MLSPPLDATQSWACWSHAVPRWTSMGGGLRRRDRLTGGCLRPGVTAAHPRPAVSPPAWGSHVRGGGRPRGVLGVRRGRGVQPEGGAASREWSWRPRGSLQGGVRTAPRVCRVASNSAALRGGVSSQHTVHRGISSAFSEPGLRAGGLLGSCVWSPRQPATGPEPHPAPRCLRRPPSPNPALACCGLDTLCGGRCWKPVPGGLRPWNWGRVDGGRGPVPPRQQLPRSRGLSQG